MSPVSNRLRAYLPLQAVQPSGSTAICTTNSRRMSSGVNSDAAATCPEADQWPFEEVLCPS